MIGNVEKRCHDCHVLAVHCVTEGARPDKGHGPDSLADMACEPQWTQLCLQSIEVIVVEEFCHISLQFGLSDVPTVHSILSFTEVMNDGTLLLQGGRVAAHLGMISARCSRGL